MIILESAQFNHLAIHRVGNKHRDEPNFVSEDETEVGPDLHEMLTEFFLKPFTKTSDKYRFTHEVDLEYHPLNGLCNKIFETPESFLEHSQKMLHHLYDQSNHPHIKSGDLFIVYFNELILDGYETKAIGIFKSERKDAFLKLEEESGLLRLLTEDGISIKKLDKGCIIARGEAENIVLSVDNNSYDAGYWKNDFLGVEILKNEDFETKAYLDLCQSFAKDVFAGESKKDEIDFVNQSVKFFEQNEEVTTEDYTKAMFEDDAGATDFKHYKQAYEQQKEIDIADEFEISETMLMQRKKAIKNKIKLDTNIQISMSFRDTDSINQFIEQGYDAEKDMNYYKVYYNRELK